MNRVLSSTGSVTPFESWNGTKPDIFDFLVFGLKVFIHIPDSKGQKLDAKGLECIYLGKSDKCKGIRPWDLIAAKLSISREGISDEKSSLQELLTNNLVDEILKFPFLNRKKQLANKENELLEEISFADEAPLANEVQEDELDEHEQIQLNQLNDRAEQNHLIDQETPNDRRRSNRTPAHTERYKFEEKNTWV